MIDVHDSQTFDWVDTICDNTQQNSAIQSETATNLKSENNCVTPLRTKENEVMNYEATQDATQEINNIAAPSIASSAVLVDLNRSVPDLLKDDPEAAKALANLKRADKDAVVAKKHLISSPQHAALKKLSGAIYRYHIANTLPWGQMGTRLLSNANLIDYQNTMNEFIKEFEDLKAEFLYDYPRAVSAAQMKLGDMFDESLYPSVYDLDRRIGVRMVFEPIADPNDFRVQVGDQAAAAMKQQFGDLLKRRVEAAYADVFKRLREPLQNMSEKLNYVEEKDKTGFHDTLVSNVTKFVELMRSCNVTNDPVMTNITNQLREALDGVTPDALRNSPTQRAETKAKVDNIIRQMPTEPTLDF